MADRKARNVPRASAAIDIGCRFFQITGGGGIWVVVGFAADHANNPHARLALEGDRTRVITIAVSALCDRKRYERLNTESRDRDAGNDEHVG